MAKAVIKKAAPPAHLTMRLFGPGMTVLHRAGLGGLACTLRYIEKAYAQGVLADEDVPGGKWDNGQPPWDMSEWTVTLRFGMPENAREYLRRLFKLAFQLKDGMIFLPGQYPDVPPPLSVRAELQNGLTLTFLQHGKTRSLASALNVVQVDPTGDGLSLVKIEYRQCDGYKHQSGWENLTNAKGSLVRGEVSVEGPLNPGAAVRHNAYSADTKACDPPERIIPLYFALVGCLALPVNRGCGVLLIPEVDDLGTFQYDRPAMTPMSPPECRVAGTGDAVLQAMTRLRTRGLGEITRLPGCLAIRFEPTTWSTQQKSRVATLAADFRSAVRFAPESPEAVDQDLDRFEIALVLLPPRVPDPEPKDKPLSKPTRRKKAAVKKPKANARESYWIESTVRPLIAENLACGRRWYDDFARLMNSSDTARKVGYEQKGLQAMADHRTFSDDDERRFIKALHRAICRGLGKIYTDTLGADAPEKGLKPNQAVKNRWNRFKEQLRLELIGSKTASQVHAAVNELLARSGPIRELLDDTTFEVVHRLLFHAEWQRIRSLALFALASYKRPADLKPIPGADESDNVTE